MLTVTTDKRWTKVIGGKKFVWSMKSFTKAEAELECSHLLAMFAQMRLDGHKLWQGDHLLTQLELHQRFGIGPFKTLASKLLVTQGTQNKLGAVKAVAPLPSVTGRVPVGPQLTFGEVVELFLTESIGMTDKKKRDLRNRLNSAATLFNGTPIGSYTRSKFVEVAETINKRDISDYYKRDIFQAIYRVFAWAANRDNLNFNAPGNLKEILKPIKSKKTAADVWAKEDTKTWRNEQITLALSKATGLVRAWILLGLNCGYGTSEIGVLEKSHLKNKGTMIQTIRGKTAKNARPAKLQHKLWKETAKAISDTMSEDGALVFSTGEGNDVASNDYVGKLYRAFCKKHKLELPQFKMLRKTSANAVKTYSNSDIASLHLGHSTKSVTEAFYTTENWKALDKATDQFRSELEGCF